LRKERKTLTRGVESRTAGIWIRDRITSVGTVTMWRAGRTTAITTSGYNATWTSTTTLSVGVGAAADVTTDTASTAAVAAAAASPASSSSCRHGTTV